MALNSNLVINRLGFTPGEATGESAMMPHDADPTYTASRLGLTVVGQDQPVAATELSAPEPVDSHDGETLDSHLGISTDSKHAQTASAVHKPFWPRFRNAASVLTIAVKRGILDKLGHKPLESPSIDESLAFVSDPVEEPVIKPVSDKPATEYRKGTFKMPTELLSRLRTFAKANNSYQYSVVAESLDEFLASRGFPADSEVQDSSEA